MIADIITIGDEILIGQIIDTNSAYIAKELNNIGIAVRQITSIQDRKNHILETLAEVSGKADVVFITGGLGPTKDDITKHTFCEFLEDKLVLNEKVLQHVEQLFTKFTTPISDMNRAQAMVPSTAMVLHNAYGTAPGMWMKKGNTVYVSMPGVPYEMKALMQNEVIPRLKKEFKRPFIYHKTIHTYGLGESAIANRIEDWENALPKHIKLAYLPSFGSVRLRLSGSGENEQLLRSSIEKEFEKIYPLLKDIITNKDGDDEDIAETIRQLLLTKNFTLATAESCTGGEIASQITKHAGVSACFKGGLVSYATEIKESVLKVPEETIEKYSVVSGEVAEKMAENVRKLFQTDYALSTTGNAGPDKGESDAEVGTVYIGVATPEKVFSQKFLLGKSREQVVKRAVNKAFELLYRDLMSKKKSG